MTHRLESIAAQLAARVRDDDPDANRRWLLAITDEHDRWALLFILAAAVPVEKPWTELLRWTEPDSPQVIAERRRQLEVALHGKVA